MQKLVVWEIGEEGLEEALSAGWSLHGSPFVYRERIHQLVLAPTEEAGPHVLVADHLRLVEEAVSLGKDETWRERLALSEDLDLDSPEAEARRERRLANLIAEGENHDEGIRAAERARIETALLEGLEKEWSVGAYDNAPHDPVFSVEKEDLIALIRRVLGGE